MPVHLQILLGVLALSPRKERTNTDAVKARELTPKCGECSWYIKSINLQSTKFKVIELLRKLGHDHRSNRLKRMIVGGQIVITRDLIEPF